jgi:subtilisin-like proprotein convertase family protein
MGRSPRTAAGRTARLRVRLLGESALERLEDRRLLSADPISGDVGLLKSRVAAADQDPLAATIGALTARPYVQAQTAAGDPDPLANSSPNGLSPGQVRHAYGIDQITFSGAIVGDGAGQTIGIVDAYDTPAALADLQAFDAAFGLADPPNFTRVAQDGSTSFPATNSGWALETALDVEWAHALAPKAKLLLIEATTNSFSNLLTAVDYARNFAGVSVVSMSWGGGEFAGENSFDSHFTTPPGHSGVTFLASTGDNGTPGGYPAYSPNVVAVGGTTLNVDDQVPLPDYVDETGWTGSGGGVSVYESQPGYQQQVVPETLTTNRRAIPDVSFDADPASGVAVYSSLAGGAATPWLTVGGTSFSAPAWGALIAIANQGRVLGGMPVLESATSTLPLLYGLPEYDFHDVTIGSNGLSTAPLYDLVTGRGSPGANGVVAALASPSVSGTVYLDSNDNHVRDAADPGLGGWTVYDDQNSNGALDLSAPSTLDSADVPMAIADLAVVASTLTVSGLPNTIADLNVQVTLHHASDADLVLTLIAPDGTAVPLATGGNGANYLGTTFDDQATTPVANGAAPFSGSYRPMNGLAVMNGKSPNGVWRLVVADNALGSTGTLNDWSLTITTSPDLVAASQVDGRYDFNKVTLGSHHYREGPQPAYAVSTPATGVYDVSIAATTTLTTQDFGNRASSVSGRVYSDSNGNGALDSGESGLAGWLVYEDLNNNGKRDIAAHSTIASTDVPKPIPDVSTITSTMTLSGLATTISDVNVNLTMHHTYDSDLVVTLTSPAGTLVTLINRAGSFGQNFINTTLDDAAATAIVSGTAPFTGSFRPDGALAALNGQNPNGVWTLTVSDVAAIDSGTLDSWSLALTLGTDEPAVTTGPDGSYAIADVGPGTHHVREVLQSGYSQTEPAGGAYHESISTFANLSNRDFGNVFGSLVAGQWLFYKGSTAWDVTNTNLPGFSDDNAIALDKTAYLPGGGAATFANVSSYTSGINGLMVDLAGAHGPITANDFVFKVGNNNSPGNWAAAVGPGAVSTRAAAGIGGSDRVELTWADGAIQKTWLEVVVKGNDALGGLNTNTGLAASRVFYFGSAAADTGFGDATDFLTSAIDEQLVRDNPAGHGNPAAITSPYDFNRDGLVNAIDQASVRNFTTGAATALKLLNVPGAGPFAPQSSGGADAQLTSAQVAFGFAADTGQGDERNGRRGPSYSTWTPVTSVLVPVTSPATGGDATTSATPGWSATTQWSEAPSVRGSRALRSDRHLAALFAATHEAILKVARSG